ncbi:MAG: ABC transporter ATP-binding protein [Pseudomonadota bacterium]
MKLELKNVSLTVGGETHIYPTSLRLADSGFNTLLGTTLSGKTTLMQLMAGLIKPTEGEIWFNDRDVTGVPVQKRNISMVYQQFINYPNLTVYENIASPLRVARVTRSEIDTRVRQMADLMKLGPMLQRKPAELSGGQQQRTAIARALVKDADLVLLDEPLANLDFKLREELRDELPRMFADRHRTVVYATTEPSEALLLGGHTVALHEGHIVEFGPTSHLYRNPATLLAAKVFSEPPINAIPVTKHGARFAIDEASTWDAHDDAAALADGPYVIGLRPHHVSPIANGPSSVAIDGHVLITELSGSESVVHFSRAEETWISQSHGIHAIEVGETAKFYFDPSNALLFSPSGERIGGSATGGDA